MKVTFWGTRGSIAKPGPTTVKYGGNTSCIEVRSDAGDLVVLDCGTGGHGLGNALMAEMARTKKSLKGSILITHTHWDHIQGIPFFVPLYVPGNEWDVYGPRGIGGSLRESLAGQMQYTYFPVELENLGSKVEYRDLVEGTFQIGRIKVTAQYMNHPCLTLGYRLECDGVSFVYACDHEPHSQRFALGELGTDEQLNAQDLRHLDFLRDADLVVHDAQYTREEYRPKIGWGHCPMECAIEMCQRSGVRKLGISHHDPMHEDAQLEQLVSEAMETILGRPLETFQEEAQLPEECIPSTCDGVENNSIETGNGRHIPSSLSLDVFIAAEGKTIEIQAPTFATDGELTQEGNTVEDHTECSCTALVEPTVPEHVVLIGCASSNNDIANRLVSAAEADKMRTIRAVSAADVLHTVRTEHVTVVLLVDSPSNGKKKSSAKSEESEVLAACNAIREFGDENHFARTVPIVVVSDSEYSIEGVTDWLILPFTDQYARTRIRAWSLRSVCRWRPACPPGDEAERMKSLNSLNLLDTDPEERFDKLTRIASRAFGVPIALVSLVDKDRQFFKSACGIDASETPRDQAFCAHAIHKREVFVVNDTLKDDRFAENPLVTGGPRIRFYAGYPLRLSNGTSPGTLCIIDSRPRDLDAGKVELLKELGGMVENELVAVKHDGRCKRRWWRGFRSRGPPQVHS